MECYVVVNGFLFFVESLREARRLQGDLKREGFQAIVKIV